MSDALTIGDTSRNELFEITDTRWDSNGTMFVTVRELVGGHCLDMSKPKVIKAMRRLARQALSHPEQTKSSRLVRTWYAECTDHATFAVSRNS